MKNEQVTLSKHIYKLCHIASLESGFFKHLSTDNPVLQLNFSSFVHLLHSVIRFGNLYYVKDKFQAQAKALGYPDSCDCSFELAFYVLRNWSQKFKSLMSGYEDYLVRRYKECYMTSQTSRELIILFADIFRFFSQQHWNFYRAVIEDYFWKILAKMSIKKIHVFGQKQSQLYSFCTSLKTRKLFLKKIAASLELEELTLARLFTESEIYIYDETIFFKMLYLP